MLTRVGGGATNTGSIGYTLTETNEARSGDLNQSADALQKTRCLNKQSILFLPVPILFRHDERGKEGGGFR
jgi:hypothetical protein